MSDVVVALVEQPPNIIEVIGRVVETVVIQSEPAPTLLEVIAPGPQGPMSGLFLRQVFAEPANEWRWRHNRQTMVFLCELRTLAGRLILANPYAEDDMTLVCKFPCQVAGTMDVFFKTH